MSKFKRHQCKIEEWPWTKETCTTLASKLEAQSKRLTEDSCPNRNYYERLKTILKWLHIEFNLEKADIYYLTEANRMRNIILHRNGEISSKDILDFPSLSEWENETMPFTDKIFKNYYNSIINTLRAIIIEAGKRFDKGKID